MNEVVQFTRNHKLTSLLAALHFDAVRLLVASHVIIEVDRNLPEYALDRGVDASRAVANGRRFYLPLIKVVEVPIHWGGAHVGVRAVSKQHSTDMPMAQLAVALAPCWCLTEDSDLVDNGFGSRNWLPLTHAVANQAQKNMVETGSHVSAVLALELVKFTGQRFARLPQLAQLLLVGAGAVGVEYWRRSGHLARHGRKLKRGIETAASIVLPIWALIAERDQNAQSLWRELEVKHQHAPCMEERVARILALDAPVGGMLASDIARLLLANVSVGKRTTIVRDALRSCPAFTEVRRGRWELGTAGSEQTYEMPAELLVDWAARAQGRPGLGLPDQD